jgi:stearoyl-CoA desaturase (delta-9 desaturase)
MAPRAPQQNCDVSVSGVLNEADVETIDGGLAMPSKAVAQRRKYKLVWRNIILFAYLHLAAVYGLWLMLSSAKWSTGIFGIFL